MAEDGGRVGLTKKRSKSRQLPVLTISVFHWKFLCTDTMQRARNEFSMGEWVRTQCDQWNALLVSQPSIVSVVLAYTSGSQVWKLSINQSLQDANPCSYRKYVFVPFPQRGLGLRSLREKKDRLSFTSVFIHWMTWNCSGWEVAKIFTRNMRRKKKYRG